MPSNKSLTTLNLNLTGITESYQYKDFSNIKITNVFLPDELSQEMKFNIAESKTSVYTNPDLLLEISNGLDIGHCSIELKSTKNNSIPGSSIQQITPTEWVIFVKHTSKAINITTGQYINSINSKLQFPDRSPRPQVAFDELNNWNINNRICDDNNCLFYSVNPIDEKLKYDLINDWQSYLADRWVEVLFSESTKANEPWYNNNLRKFILKFLERYDHLNDKEKSELKDTIISLIK